MGGLYIHIPFCKQACHYCNFHFTVSLKHKNELLKALVRELQLRADYLGKLDSIYFGGGTPSLLSGAELESILSEVAKRFEVAKNAEITLEANPDDIEPAKLKDYRSLGINRISLGVQSFFQEDLELMNRVHDTGEAIKSIRDIQEAGFQNYSIDLIYGTPTLSTEQWAANLEQSFSLDVPHISAYCLTVEPKTALAHQISKGTVPDVDEASSAEQFEYLMDAMEAQGYHHYEISNFSKPGFEAKHNSSYWSGAYYLGIGPSAHSFNGKSRSWNPAHNSQYIKAINAGELPLETEELSPKQRFNEYLMTSLRTSKGCDQELVKEQFGKAAARMLEEGSRKFLKDQLMEDEEQHYKLSRKGKLLADHIIAELFME